MNIKCYLPCKQALQVVCHTRAKGCSQFRYARLSKGGLVFSWAAWYLEKKWQLIQIIMKDDIRWNLEIVWHWMVRTSRCLKANLGRLELPKPKNVVKKNFVHALRSCSQYPSRLAGDLFWRSNLSVFYRMSLLARFKLNRNKPSRNLHGQKCEAWLLFLALNEQGVNEVYMCMEGTAW